MTIWDKTKEIRKNIVEICKDILYLIIFLFIVWAIFLAALTIIDEFKIREYSKKCSNEVSATKWEEVNTIKVLDTWKDIKIKMKDYNFKDYKFKWETANLIFICNTENDGSINVQYTPKELESSTTNLDVIPTSWVNNEEVSKEQLGQQQEKINHNSIDFFSRQEKCHSHLKEAEAKYKDFTVNVYYSPVLDTCILDWTNVWDWDWIGEFVWTTERGLRNFYTNEQLFHCTMFSYAANKNDDFVYEEKYFDEDTISLFETYWNRKGECNYLYDWASEYLQN